MRTPLLLTLALLAVVAAGCNDKLTCPQGETACGGRCVSLLSDADHCGACGNACGALGVCSAGTCGCAPGVAVCGGACTDLARDPRHCGGCDTACGAGELCLAAADATTCTASCPAGFTACQGACVDVQSDRLHCGACGRTCPTGQTCRDGACAAAVQVACFATGDVRPVTADLVPAGPPRLALGSPTVLAASADMIYTGNGFPAGLGVLPLDDRLPPRLTVLPGDDVEGVTTYANAVLVSNAGVGTLVVADASGAVLDEIVLPGDAPNPHGVAMLGTTAWVALYGDGPNGFSGRPDVTGQALAAVDLSALPACMADAAPPACGQDGACGPGRECRDGACRLRCGTVSGVVDLLAVAGAADADAYPFPHSVAARGDRVYVTLANLRRFDLGNGSFGYLEPAGHGRLAVVDTARANAVTIVDLGPECGNPGSLAVSGATAWVACGSFSFPAAAPSRIIPVDLGNPQAPVVQASVDASGIVPGGLAICGGLGYVTDQASGAVMRFDPSTRAAEAPVTVCPTQFFAFASDVACP